MRATRKLQHIAPSRYLSPSLIIEVASFSLYFFTWKLCMSVTLGRTPHLADPGVIGNVYAILLAFTGLGYVLFWVAGAYLPGSMEKRTAAAAAMSLCVTGAIGGVQPFACPASLSRAARRFWLLATLVPPSIMDLASCRTRARSLDERLGLAWA